MKKELLKREISDLMTKHIPEFYESIVEASNRGELWGVDVSNNDTMQLEIDFNLSQKN